MNLNELENKLKCMHKNIVLYILIDMRKNIILYILIEIPFRSENNKHKLKWNKMAKVY